MGLGSGVWVLGVRFEDSGLGFGFMCLHGDVVVLGVLGVPRQRPELQLDCGDLVSGSGFRVSGLGRV